MTKLLKTMDGNEAAAYISYAFTEVAAIYPITPSSPMAESVDEWSAHGKLNIFGQPVKVVEMQSEAGAAGAMHGSLEAGALTTTYTSAQGLLLMIPNMYKMAGELLPGVLHVSARALAAHALSIFGDHQDVMACRQTGVAMLASGSVQEVMDLGCIAHLAAIKARLPFLHFFDGFRTSHEYQKIEVLDYNDAAKLLDTKALRDFRKRALNPEHPVIRGTAQNPDIYFQGREAANPFYDAVPEIVEGYMAEINQLTGRSYHLFDYYGAPDAERVIVAMGSVCDTIEETIDCLMQRGEKVGMVRIRLYRPFSIKHFLAVLPKTVRKVAVLDRTKEPGAPGEPLYLDVVNAFYGTMQPPIIVGGRYGLGSKDTRPAQIFAVFRNLEANTPQNHFTIGIIDDVTHTSLPEAESPCTTPRGIISCKFWGLGSDGTVGANKATAKIIGEKTPLYVQAYFSYDSKKSGGTTISHLRFGKQPIKEPYLINNADYVACHNYAFLYNHHDLLKGLKKQGVFVLNCPWSEEELTENIPPALQRYIAENEIRFYIINAVKIAGDIGLGNRINMVMQSAFFKVADIIPLEDAVKYLKDSIEELYGDKGQKIVDMNNAAVDQGVTALRQVKVPDAWRNAAEEDTPVKEEPEFVKRIQRPMAQREGDLLPVSAFAGMEDGTFPLGTTAYEKRGIAPMVPQWQIEKCIQCNQCSYICPHAVVRPFLLNDAELKRAPQGFATKPAVGKGLEGLAYRIQVSPLDCTGCGSCADICPGHGKAVVMQNTEREIANQAENWEFAMTVTAKDNLMDLKTVKGSQFARPLFEFNGACPGCGETPYLKLLTQLFGDRMMIANATGCSSIYGASAPSIPYTTNADGKGPAWANSLFEDNAEYGYGMLLGINQLRERLAALMEQALQMPINPELGAAFREWLNVMHDGAASKQATAKILSAAEQSADDNAIIRRILAKRDFLIKKSNWCIGGDGWAYDIGYGGVDHVLASGDDINMLVMDTEVYSNTGGQASKATPTAAVAKFASAGKKIRKKDLGLMAMSYGYVYVAQIAMGANMQQTITAITEAESYHGPSLIIAYSPCINHGIKAGMGSSMMEEKRAVAAGYWHLYRFNPLRKAKGENPFMLDSPPPTEPYDEFIRGEIRFTSLANVFPEAAKQLFKESAADARERYDLYRRLAENGCL